MKIVRTGKNSKSYKWILTLLASTLHSFFTGQTRRSLPHFSRNGYLSRKLDILMTFYFSRNSAEIKRYGLRYLNELNNDQ